MFVIGIRVIGRPLETLDELRQYSVGAIWQRDFYREERWIKRQNTCFTYCWPAEGLASCSGALAEESVGTTCGGILRQVSGSV